MSHDRPHPALLSRRSIMRAAAWSMPVIAVAASTPLAAASTEPTAATMTITSTGSTTPGNGRGIGVFGNPNQVRMVQAPYSFPSLLDVTNGSIPRTLVSATAVISGPMSFNGPKYGSLAVAGVGAAESTISVQAPMTAGFGGTTSIANLATPMAVNETRQFGVAFAWAGSAPASGASYDTSVHYTLTFDDNSTVSLSGAVSFIF